MNELNEEYIHLFKIDQVELLLKKYLVLKNFFDTAARKHFFLGTLQTISLNLSKFMKY